jgi:hypothetical protein
VAQVGAASRAPHVPRIFLTPCALTTSPFPSLPSFGNYVHLISRPRSPRDYYTITIAFDLLESLSSAPGSFTLVLAQLEESAHVHCEMHLNCSQNILTVCYVQPRSSRANALPERPVIFALSYHPHSLASARADFALVPQLPSNPHSSTLPVGHSSVSTSFYISCYRSDENRPLRYLAD